MKRTIAFIVVAFLVFICFACKRPPSSEPEDRPQPGADRDQGFQTCGDAEITDGLTSVRPPAGEEPAYGDILVRQLEAEPPTLSFLRAGCEVYVRAVPGAETCLSCPEKATVGRRKGQAKDGNLGGETKVVPLSQARAAGG